MALILAADLLEDPVHDLPVLDPASVEVLAAVGPPAVVGRGRAEAGALELGPILKVAVWEPPVYPSQVALDAAYLEAVEAAEARP
jgi:hypothetical protein